MATLFNPFFQVVDGNGAPIAGAKLYFYTTGTSTPQNTYAQSDLDPGSVNTNPVIADADGRFGPIYLGTSDYKVILKDASDVTIETLDPILVPSTSIIINQGDLIIGNADGAAARLPIGVADRVLLSSGTTASWEQVSLETSGVLKDVLPKSRGGIGSVIAKPSFTILTAYSSDTGMTMPYDDTIPQITDGKQIFAVSYTVGTTTNKLRLTVNGSFDCGNDAGCIALFKDSSADAVACHWFSTSADNPWSQTAVFYLTPTSGAHTYRVRVGSATGVIAINGIQGSRKGGGVNQTTFTIEELPTT